eukprot:TRINITY_DN44316_c0_g1_i1.p1 TRINITY_DN44316_c0_g1~~TRINITY_DN44316_c0_g1_i1.p1  ORF type:complete len:416 (+),score=49.75 TRINITY_DN44316_c0_g1_i1:88-1335(+)
MDWIASINPFPAFAPTFRTDPFTATTGRKWLPTTQEEPIVHTGVTSNLPQKEHAPDHKKEREAAAFISIVLLLLGATTLVYCATLVMRDRKALWSQQSWAERSCVIKGVGIAYRGNCPVGSIRSGPYQSFAECTGNVTQEFEAAHHAWLQSDQGMCAGKADSLYRKAPLPGATEQARRLIDADHARLCYNGFLPWAEVIFAGDGSSVNQMHASGPMCAFQFGAPFTSTSGDWDSTFERVSKLHKELISSTHVKCWVIEIGSCVVVSLEDATTLKTANAVNVIVTKTIGFACLGLAAVAAVFALRWQLMDHGLFGVIPPQGYESAVPLDEPGEDIRNGSGPEGSLLSERVKALVSVAAARLRDNTPTASGESSLRLSRGGSRRSVAIGGTAVPRNVAADFVASAFGARQAPASTGI